MCNLVSILLPNIQVSQRCRGQLLACHNVHQEILSKKKRSSGFRREHNPERNACITQSENQKDYTDQMVDRTLVQSSKVAFSHQLISVLQMCTVVEHVSSHCCIMQAGSESCNSGCLFTLILLLLGKLKRDILFPIISSIKVK